MLYVFVSNTNKIKETLNIFGKLNLRSTSLSQEQTLLLHNYAAYIQSVAEHCLAEIRNTFPEKKS